MSLAGFSLLQVISRYTIRLQCKVALNHLCLTNSKLGNINICSRYDACLRVYVFCHIPMQTLKNCKLLTHFSVFANNRKAQGLMSLGPFESRLQCATSDCCLISPWSLAPNHRYGDKSAQERTTIERAPPKTNNTRPPSPKDRVPNSPIAPQSHHCRQLRRPC